VDPAQGQDFEALLLEVSEDFACVTGGHAVGFYDGQGLFHVGGSRLSAGGHRAPKARGRAGRFVLW
jgi:hypothetical protein